MGSPEVIAALSKVYGVGQQLMMLWQLARQDAFADKYKRFMQLEAKATVRYEYAGGVIPGLLQTEGYAREVFEATRPRDENELSEEVAARLGRQDLLRREDAPHFRAILDESVLRRKTRDPKEWTRQLEHLLEASQLPNVTLQVLPFEAGPHGLMGTSVTVLWLPDGKAVAYTEHAHSGELIEDPSEVEKLRLSYDLLRDLALSPRDSVAFIERLIEENTPCAPEPT